MRHLPDRDLLVTELLTAVLAAAGGAAVMYFLDPSTGQRRRALVRDRAAALSHDAGQLALAQGRRAADQLKGVVASGRALVGRSSEPDGDEPLDEEIRSESNGRSYGTWLALFAIAAPLALWAAAEAAAHRPRRTLDRIWS